MTDKYKAIVVMTIDRHPPGEDVTGVYSPDVLDRLVEEGYIKLETPKPKAKGGK